MNQSGLFRPGNDAWSDTGLLGDRLQELTAVFGLSRGARGNGNHLVDAVGFAQTPEFREDLECRVHGLGGEGATVEPARPEADHLLLAVDDLVGQIRPDLHDNHMNGISADVDRRDPHGSTIIQRPAVLVRSQLLRKRLNRLTRTLQGLEQGEVMPLHRARVASRRLRELVPVLQLEPGPARRLGRRLRKITSRLGRVRELDVLLLLVDELHVSRRFHEAALSRMAMTVSKERDRTRKHLSDRLPVDRVTKVAKRLARIIEELREKERGSTHDERAWRWAIEASVVRRASRLQAAVDEAGAVYLPGRLHAVRIAVKKLRYALELAAEVQGAKTNPDLRLLKRAQDVLGRMHDRQVLIDRVREEQAALSPPNVAVWRELDGLVAAVEDDCRRLHAHYMRMRSELVALTQKLSAQGRGRTFAPLTRRAG